MAFQVSPGVQVTEKDLTNVVPAVATSIAGIVMAAERGPTDTITAIASEQELVQIFGEEALRYLYLLYVLLLLLLDVLHIFFLKFCVASICYD